MFVKCLEDSWKEERNRFFCRFSMDVADEHERSMLIIGEIFRIVQTVKLEFCLRVGSPSLEIPNKMRLSGMSYALLI